MIFKDQMLRVFELQSTPKRIVSLVPSQTELLVSLGLKDSIVGLTKFCVHPKSIKQEKTRVGGTKDIKLDKIKALNPDIILCNKEENTKAIVEDCSTICPVHVSDIYTIADNLELITQYGKLFSIEEEAQKLIETITLEYDVFKDFITHKKHHRVAYFIWRKPWMVAASNTYLHNILELNKFDNVFKDQQRYPEITLDSLKRLNPDLIFLSSEPYPFKEKHCDELREIFPNAVIKLVDGEAFSWYGSRLLVAFKYFKALKSELT